MHRHVGEHHHARKKPHSADHWAARRGWSPDCEFRRRRAVSRAHSSRPNSGRSQCCALAPHCADRRRMAKRRGHAGGLLYAGDPSSGQTFRRADRGRRCIVHGSARRSLGLSRSERRRQIDDDEDDHRLCRTHGRHRDRLRPRHCPRADRGKAVHRLSARGRPRLSRHDARPSSSALSPISAALPDARRNCASAGWSR